MIEETIDDSILHELPAGWRRARLRSSRLGWSRRMVRMRGAGWRSPGALLRADPRRHADSEHQSDERTELSI
jgi:hypothetical protein